MIRQDIHIEDYWDIIVVYDVYLGEKNSGFTHTDFKKKLSIVAIGKADSKKQFLNTIVHEAKHVQSHICMYYDIPEDGEDAAYLIGYIVMKMYSSFRDLLCQC
jgi:hypothetical protein